MSFDLLLNSLNLFLKEMYGDQCREFVRGYWSKTNLATATFDHHMSVFYVLLKAFLT